MDIIDEIKDTCNGAPDTFTESVMEACRSLFEGDTFSTSPAGNGAQPGTFNPTAAQQANSEPIPVNTQNIVGSDAGSALAAKLTAAQQAQTAADAEKEKAVELQGKADAQIDSLKQTMMAASEEKQDGQA